MKKLLLSVVTAIILLASCQKESHELTSPEKRKLASSESELKALINQALTEQGTTDLVKAITHITYADKEKKLIALVAYTSAAGQSRTTGVITEYGDTESEFVKTIITCKGTCSNGNNCQVGGVLAPNGDIEYLECTCAGCKMNISVVENTLKPKNTLKAMAKQSYEATFGSAAEVEITKYENIADDKAMVHVFEFTGSDGRSSSFMIIKPLVPGITVNGRVLEINKSFEVDCTGSCDCRERWYPATGAVECTCSPCKMKVTEVKAE